jgi:hypothetical protein
VPRPAATRAARTSAAPRRRNASAATAFGIFAGGSLVGGAANALLLVDAVKTHAPIGVGIAAALGLLGWLVLAAGFGAACGTFLGLTRDRVAALRGAAFAGAASFSIAFLAELSSVGTYAVHGARGTFVGAHGLFGIYDLLAAVAATIAALAVTPSGNASTRRANASFGWASITAGGSFLMLAGGSLLYLVTYATAGANAGLTAGIGAQIAAGVLAAAGASIVATAFLGKNRRRGHRGTVLAAGAGVLALAFGVAALGAGLQATIAGAHGLDSRTAAAAWLDTARQVGWAAALFCAALGSARSI